MQEILANLESAELSPEGLPRIAEHAPAPEPAAQMPLFPPQEHEVVRALRGLDPDRLTPLEALQLVHSWRGAVEGPARSKVG